MTFRTGISNNRCQDRRQSMPFFCLFHLGIKAGRRVGERRKGHAKTGYVDYYANHYLMPCVIAILILSAVDALLTLNILESGGEELNRLMAILIEYDTGKFIAFKLALTALAVLLLVIHHNAPLTGNVRVRHVKYGILFGYCMLIGYEFYLLELISITSIDNYSMNSLEMAANDEIFDEVCR